MKYLFWNTYRNHNINEILSELIIENDVSIVLLAEYTADANELVDLLALKNVRMNKYGSCSDRIKMFGQVGKMEYRIDTEQAIIRIINNKDMLCIRR